MTADELKALRRRLGLTQAALSAELGVSVRTLQNWEQGRRAIGRYAAAWLDRETAKLNAE